MNATSSKSARWFLKVVALAALAVALAACSSSSNSKSSTATPAASASSTPGATTASPVATTRAASSGPRPNVLFILTDDMRYDDMQYLPQIKQLIGDQGMTFDN